MTVREWISTKERLPEARVDVLIVRYEPKYDVGPTIYIGSFDPLGGYYTWRTSEIDLGAEVVIAWMPLPALPPVE